eukprot:TRINITY_DN225_c0_g2_i1.p1 TRINITY_DN225_c0_g2~~TRINITY_DN225_c0_g2_i1.p1  ORF type:complete len:921 (+),score=450.68 TRINITY_DN225_c0_g2_i1:80-2842(+)
MSEYQDPTQEEHSPARSTMSIADRLSKLPNHRVRQMKENEKRVQRMKCEKSFMAEVQARKAYRLADYQRVQEKVMQQIQDRTQQSPQRVVTPKPTEPQFDPVKVVHEFSGSIRCLELTQGGATIWTGDNDGTISIRNGMTGEIVHHIPSSGGLYVDSLFATETHMWVGMNDGTVRIYDHLVYILVSEATFHKESVTCFTSTFDGKVFSASSDASIVKWDTEANGFALMTKLVGYSTSMIRCMACYGYNLFTGGDDAIIRCMDTEAGSGQELRDFAGHEDAVNCLVVQDGYLFSGSKDTTIKAWNMEHGECIWTFGDNQGPVHQAPVTSFIGDTVAHRFWSADAEGTIHVWESTPENDFQHVMQLKGHEGPPVISLRAFCTIDAIKLWSLAANGKNRIWYSSVNRMEDAVQSTIDAMETIIQQDLIELAKWKELINKLRQVDERRKTELASALMGTCEAATMRAYLHKWHRWLGVNRQNKRREKIKQMLEAGSTKRTLFTYYQKLERFYVAQKNLRRKQAMVRGLQAQNKRSLQMMYWKKMKCFAMVTKQRGKALQFSDAVAGRAFDGLYRGSWKTWKQFVDLKSRSRRRDLVSDNIARLSEKTVLQTFYFKLRSYRLYRLKLDRRSRCSGVLESAANRQTAFYYFKKLLFFTRMSRHKRRRIIQVEIFGKKADAKVLSVYYSKLHGFYSHAKKDVLRSKIEAEQATHEDLSAQYSAKKAVLERLKLLEDKRREIQDAMEARATAEKRRAKAEEDLAKLQEQLQAKESGTQEDKKERTKNEMVEDIMAKLKAKCLNYHLDYSTIQKIRDQTRQIPTYKIFLEAHMSIKRVVIDVTKMNQVAGARWKGLDKAIDNIPDHQKSTILHSIKTMIVCYDLMSTETKDDLETDDEILENTDYLETMVNIAVRHRDSKLGRAAYRVR